MPALARELRNKLERAVIEARDVAEAGARMALEGLAVHHHEPYPHQTPEQRKLRNHLRARARQLGNTQTPKGALRIDHLVHECAYEHWHRMLFARFLAENDLLIEPSSGVAISLQECEELAKEAKTDLWTYASQCAQQMLPQIFRPDDPLLQVTLAREHRVKLEHLLAGLDQATFKADDSLGWVYQFWQTKRKQEVNESGKKIGADELPAVTQLFTEPYMVQFLLHNTLGAWWAGKVLAARPDLAQTAASEEDLRRACALPGCEWTYLRFVRAEEGGPWRPAAGTFGGWPERAADITVLDPCCGSGHFLVEAFRILVPMRMAEEGFSAREACDAVLRDNVFGLEIDERCTQIAAFNLALAAWSYPGAGGYRPVPELHIACSGLAVGAKEEEWLKLAGRDERLREGMRRLYRLFQDAPTLGSLIDPRREEADLLRAGFDALRPLLEQALARQEVRRDAQATEAGIAAQGMAKAAALLAGSYTLVITNVPYLGGGKQDAILKTHLERHYEEGKADLATAFLLRCLDLCAQDGTAALVTPQNWLFLTTYRKLRELLLKQRTWNVVARLGPGAFETIGGHVVNVSLLTLSATKPGDASTMAGIDVSAAKQPAEKAALLRGELPAEIAVVPQAAQLNNPDARITLVARSVEDYLFKVADSYQGVKTGDNDRLCIRFWELPNVRQPWRLMQSSASSTCGFDGCTDLINWDNDGAMMARLQGLGALGAYGVGVGGVSSLPACFFLGQLFDSAIIPIVAKNKKDLPAIAALCFDPSFRESVRQVDQKVAVTTATVLKVPFDIEHWQRVAAEKYPHGLPEPQTNDPTQWLFHGHPAGMVAAGPASASPFGIGDPVGADRHPSLICRTPNVADVLQVAVARLVGYRWPAELDPGMRLDVGPSAWVERCGELADLADSDGIVCIPPVRGKERAADRLRKLLAAAYGKDWKPTTELELIRATGSNAADLEEWLRNEFFQQHCDLFHQRPFLWHIWDGRKRDGFHALVNCHKLAEGGGKGRKLLENLTYSYLGDWISRQQDGVKRREDVTEDRLVAALELQKRLIAILEGGPLFDLFVRWKPLHGQPIGWEPDINDGVRVNIRPFMASDLPNGRSGAGVLRWKPNIKWDKDRGKEPERPKPDFPWFWGWDGKTVDFMGGKEFTGERFNDCHYTVAAKRRAREAAGKEAG